MHAYDRNRHGHDLSDMLTVCKHARQLQPRDSSRSSLAYTSHKGPNLANQNRRKLGVFDRKLEDTTPYFIVILIDIRESESRM